MGKEAKEDSGFGFKDKAKAEETIRLLEAHDMNYRRLTVRGLLGRAKRVLSMTKAEDKIKNIKEAMKVFEDWLATLENDKEKKNKQNQKKKESTVSEKHDSEDSGDDVIDENKVKESKTPDKVPGLGFKDKAAAEGTLKALEGRDPDYQQLAIKGLIKSAKRVLTCTRDETKLSNINEAISIFEKFLDNFESSHMSKQNNPYLSLNLVKTSHEIMDKNLITDQHKAFLTAYSSVGGDYKKLRTVPECNDGKTWDIVRNAQLKTLKEKYSEMKLFDDKNQPTPEHLEMLIWAYSPEPAKIKKYVPESQDNCENDKSSNRKRKSSETTAEGSKNKQMA